MGMLHGICQCRPLRDLLRADLEQAANELSETRRYILGETDELPPA